MRHTPGSDAPREIEGILPCHRDLGREGRKNKPTEKHVPEEPESTEEHNGPRELEHLEGEAG